MLTSIGTGSVAMTSWAAVSVSALRPSMAAE